MAIEIRFTETEKQQVRDRHGDAVVERLQKVIEQKNETLQWKSGVEECRRRFYQIVQKQGEYFPEVFFTAEHREYRAILVWVPEYDVFAFQCVVKKADHYQTSKQHEILNQIYQHPKRIAAKAEQDLADTHS